ncbi:EAL and GGDEF domain-containing protein [Candidatus Symbiobacter mobilis]|nr:EAL domain-containing protein [Candidatus Symbiobacter mobilis]
MLKTSLRLGMLWALLALALPCWATPPHVLIVYSWHDQLPWQAGVRSGIAEHVHTPPVSERPILLEERIDAVRAPSVWDTYRWELATIAAVMVIQAALILLLLRSMRERRKALDDLGQERALLEQRVQERTAALAQSESYLRTIIDNEPEGIQIVDADGHLVQINAAGLAMLEADDPERVVGATVVHFLAPNYRNAFLDLHQRVLAGAKRKMQFEIIGLRGTSRWLETHAVPMHSNGSTVHLALLRDIDDRKKAEAALERYRQNLEANVRMLRNITAQLPGMVYQFLLRPDGSACFPYASEGIAGICGLTAEDVRNDATPAFARVHPDDVPTVWRSAQVSATTGQTWRLRFRVVNDDGSMRWIDGSGTPRTEPDGSCLWHGFMTDATADIEAQNSLRLAASVFANAQEGITITDADCRILDINPAFSRITGYRREEVLGKTPKLLSSGHHDEQFYRRMWQSLHDQGTWRGEVWNRSKRGEVYPELLSIAVVKDNAGQVSHYIGSFSDITGIKEREAQLNRLAHYDPLTDLPNRRLFTDRLRQGIALTQRQGKIMAVCVIDIDRLQAINDFCGLPAGDQVLVELSRRIRACLRERDTAARLGGDAFALLLLDLKWVEECDTILRRILLDLAAAVMLDKQSASTTASMGVAMFPQDGQDPETLLRRADTALREAKKAGGAQYRLYNPEHDRLVRENRRLIEDLTQAISHDQFILHYQPRVEIATGKVTSVEAMIRWRHPERGLLMPAEFLYAMSDTELETHLGIWVLHNALGQIAQWKRHELRLPISINLSARDICHAGFPDGLAKALSQHPTVVGADLEIEVPESQALAHAEDMATVIAACHDLGVRIALDGFGMGNSPLSYFRTLPVDVLKIDQDYVRDIHQDPDDLATVDGIVKIARAFRRDVVAVGVEHPEQGQILLQLGCRYAQGYAYAMPMPADSLAQWMGQR